MQLLFYRFTCSIGYVTDDSSFWGSGSRRREGVLFTVANDTLWQTNPPSLLALADDMSAKELSAPSVQASRDLNLTKQQNLATGTIFQGTNTNCTARRQSKLAAHKNKLLSCPSKLSKVWQYRGRTQQRALISHSVTGKFCYQ